MTLSYLPQLPACRRFLQALRLPWSKPQRKNLLLLTTAFLTERRLPIRRLARTLAGPGPAQRALDKRLRRFLGNQQLDLKGALAAYLAFLLPRLGPLPYVPVVLDWTLVGRTHAVLWAQIPYRGRSFPLYALVLPWRRQGDTATEVALVETLEAAWPPGAPRPLLVGDGGFPKGPLLQWLQEHRWGLLVRTRKDALLYPPEERVPLDLGLDRLKAGEVRCYCGVFWRAVCPFPLQVVVTNHPTPAGERRPYVLFTNLSEEQLPWVTRLYAQRMQPEQTHRDCKHGHYVSGYGLAHLKRLRPDRLARLLFCLGLIYALLLLLAEQERQTREWLQQRHWGLSLATFGLDLVRAAGPGLLAAVKQALAWVRFQPLWPETGDS